MIAIYPLGLCLIVTVAVVIRTYIQEKRAQRDQRNQELLLQAFRRIETA